MPYLEVEHSHIYKAILCQQKISQPPHNYSQSYLAASGYASGDPCSIRTELKLRQCTKDLG